jgi:hypothetical protein
MCTIEDSELKKYQNGSASRGMKSITCPEINHAGLFSRHTELVKKLLGKVQVKLSLCFD